MDVAPRLRSSPMPRVWPSWLISVCLHGLLLLVLSIAWRQGGLAETQPEVAAREIGIVFREAVAPAAEAAEAPSTTAVTSAVNDALPRLPPPEFRSTDVLPRPVGVPPASGDGIASASALARGGAPRVAVPTRQGRVEVFGIEGIGSRFVFVFDRSVSMEGPPLAAAKLQLRQAIQALESTHQFQVVFFNHLPHLPDLTAGQRRLPMATDPNKQAAYRFIDGVSAGGGTDRYSPLMRAIHLRPDVIFFLTDADDPMSSDEVAEVRQRNGGLATLHTIEFGRGESQRRDNFLVRLAAENGGKYAYVNVTPWGS